jgi:hypothetical protein
LLVHTKVEVFDNALRGKLHLFALVGPSYSPIWCWQLRVVPRGRRPQTYPRSARTRAPGHRVQSGVFSPLSRLRRRQRWLAGPDGQLQNGLGISRRRAGQYRANGRNRAA